MPGRSTSSLAGFRCGARSIPPTRAAISFSPRIVASNLYTNRLAAGDPLIEVQREAENGLEFARKARFGYAVDLISAQLGLVRTLLGLTAKFGSFDDQSSTRRRIERRLSSNPDLAQAECWYWIRKLQARFFAGDYAAALDASSRARRLALDDASVLRGGRVPLLRCTRPARQRAIRETQAERAAACSRLSPRIMSSSESGRTNCPENFENRAALVGAEIARIEGRDLDAMRLYEQAIRSARENGFIHNEAIAYELAARFYAARGFETIAQRLSAKRPVLLSALGRRRQGSAARRVVSAHSAGRSQRPARSSTIGAPVEHLDLATVIKVSQAVSGEIVLEKLIDTLMRTAIEQAGAERGLLILPRGAEQRIAAEATTSGDTVIVHQRDEAVAEAMLPESVLHYVLRTRESVILDDAAAQSAFAEDPYIRERQARSILCLPLINQAKLNGVLYLENNLARRVFAPARTAVLKLLASQAAICAGEHPFVPRSGGTRSENPAPRRRQHHRHLRPVDYRGSGRADRRGE